MTKGFFERRWHASSIFVDVLLVLGIIYLCLLSFFHIRHCYKHHISLQTASFDAKGRCCGIRCMPRGLKLHITTLSCVLAAITALLLNLLESPNIINTSIKCGTFYALPGELLFLHKFLLYDILILRVRMGFKSTAYEYSPTFIAGLRTTNLIGFLLSSASSVFFWVYYSKSHGVSDVPEILQYCLENQPYMMALIYLFVDIIFNCILCYLFVRPLVIMTFESQVASMCSHVIMTTSSRRPSFLSMATATATPTILFSPTVPPKALSVITNDPNNRTSRTRCNAMRNSVGPRDISVSTAGISIVSTPALPPQTSLSTFASSRPVSTESVLSCDTNSQETKSNDININTVAGNDINPISIVTTDGRGVIPPTVVENDSSTDATPLSLIGQTPLAPKRSASSQRSANKAVPPPVRITDTPICEEDETDIRAPLSPRTRHIEHMTRRRRRRTLSNSDESDFSDLITRVCILTCFMMLCTCVNISLYASLKIMSLLIMEMCVNCTMLLLMFKFYNKPYKFFCGRIHSKISATVFRGVVLQASRHVSRSRNSDTPRPPRDL